MSKRILITDVECYQNYFLVALEDEDTKEQFEYSVYGEDNSLSREDRRQLRRVIQKHQVKTFNGRNYDMVLITAACQGYTCGELKGITNEIIEGNQKPWDIEREYGFKVPQTDHIDMIEVAIGRASLKIYNGRVHGRRMQDLPYEPNRVLTREEAANVCDYCFNDLDATRNLGVALAGQLDLRNELTKIHGIDLRSKSDAQVAEAIIRKEMVRITGKCDKPDLKKWAIGSKFYYDIPKFIKFKSKKLNDVLDLIRNTPFKIGKGGYVNLPEALKNDKIRINDGLYTMGIGGLHSNEKSTSHIADEDTIIRDSDVTSYYPRIILNLGLYPSQLGRTFLKIYNRIVEERVAAKREVERLTESLVGVNDPDRIAKINAEIRRNQIAADGGKIQVNGSFGKFGSKWSVLYSPKLLIQTTITGQLSLLMLIEALEDAGIEVVSANTDGIISKFPKWMEDTYLEIMEWWQEETGFNMEFTDYAGVYSRDVNSYIAVGMNGKVKTKGAYSLGALSNNPQTEICIDAVIAHLTGKGSIISTIKGCTDIRKFITLRTVNGGAIWPVRGDGDNVTPVSRVMDGQFLGKAIRWYYAKGVDWAIHYKKPTKTGNHNKVPKSDGAKPIMEFKDTPKSMIKFDSKGKPINPYQLPSDLDYAWYLRRSYEILEEIGLESDPTVKVTRRRKKEEEPCAVSDKYGIAESMTMF